MDNTITMNLSLPTCNVNLSSDFVNLMLNVLVWNCKGLVILTEAMLNGDRLTSQAKKLKSTVLQVLIQGGLSGGIPILWNSFNLDINSLGLTE